MKNKKFYLSTITIMIINYIFLTYEFNFCTIKIHLIDTIILIIPIIIIILMYILQKKEKLKDNLCLAISILLIIINFILIFFTFINVTFVEGTSYEDNPKKYEHIYSISSYKKYIYQFPNKISDKLIQNNNVKFYYCPQFLQGGFNLELLMKMDNEEINNYIQKYEDNIKEIIEVNGENKKELESKYGIFKSRGCFEQEEYSDFLYNCKIYLLDSTPYKENNWNHGRVIYMAKNEELQQLLIVTQIW